MRDKKEHFFDLKVTSMGYTHAGGLFVENVGLSNIFGRIYAFLKKELIGRSEKMC